MRTLEFCVKSNAIAFSYGQDVLLSVLTYFHDGTLHLGQIIGTTYGSIYRTY